MDYLDPRKKRAHTIRLSIGYIVAAIAVMLGTVILVYGAYGYGINTKTGAIIQNGLLFTNSKPAGAEVYLDGADQRTATASRLVIPAGDYSLSLSRSGYRTWQRNFTLSEHSIARYIYPFLFPDKPDVSLLKSYSAMPTLITQTPDRHWTLVRTADSNTVTFDEYDSTDLTKPAQSLVLPAGILSSSLPGQLTPLEWTSDSNSLLLKHTYSGGQEFIVFTRDKPAQSFNVNKLLGISPSEVALRNKKINQLYIYDAVAKTLSVADTGKAVVAAPLLHSVLAFKPHGADLISYVTDKGAPATQVQVRIWDGKQSYNLANIRAGGTYLLNESQYQGHWYYVAGSSQDSRIVIYKDPLDSLRDPKFGKALPILALQEQGATNLSFSENARFIAAEAGQKFAVYDIETQTPYRYALAAPIAGPLLWMDGYRLIGQSDGKVFVSDYDSTNQQLLTATAWPEGGLFTRDFNHMMSFRQVADGSYEFINVDMRAGSDLPKKQ